MLDDPDTPVSPSADRRAVLALLAVLAALAVPALADPGAVGRGAALLDLAASEHPYLATRHAVLRWAWIPAVTLSTLALVLAPGLLLAYVSGAARSAAEWLLLGLAVSTVAVSAVVESAERVIGGPLLGRAFAAVVLGTAVAAGLAALALARPGRTLRLRRSDTHTLLAASVGSYVVLVGFEPKFLWESFNGDGAHAYESARMLLHRAIPFWGPDAGAMASYPGVTSFLASYPTAWFIRLFGEIEASARIPYLLFLVGMFAGLVAVIEKGDGGQGTGDRGREAGVGVGGAGIRTAWLLWPALIVLTAVLGFSATYNPYHADIALPATQDVLVLAWFLGFAWAFVTRRHSWMVAFAGLTYTTSPAGQLLLGFWLVAAALFQRPFPVRTFAMAAGAVALWFAFAKVSPALLAALGQTGPGSEHATGSLARRLLNVQWRQWRRLVWVVVPGGILPALAVPLLWRQDRTARTLAATAAAAFAFFYVQGRVSLHYFVPAMVLPLAVFWRMVPAAWPLRRVGPLVAGAALLALALSLPRHPEPHLAARAVGARIEDRLPGYAAAEPGAFRRSELLSALLPRDAHHTVPDSSYGGSPLSWYYYAHRAPATRMVAYVLATDSLPPPGTERVTAAHGVGLFLADPAALAQDRGLRPAAGIARLYRIDKRTLFRGN